MRPVFSELWDRDVGLVLDALLQSPEDLTRTEIKRATRLSSKKVDKAIARLFHLEAIYAGGNLVTRNRMGRERSESLYYVRREGQRGIGAELRRLYEALSPYADLPLPSA